MVHNHQKKRHSFPGHWEAWHWEIRVAFLDSPWISKVMGDFSAPEATSKGNSWTPLVTKISLSLSILNILICYRSYISIIWAIYYKSLTWFYCHDLGGIPLLNLIDDSTTSSYHIHVTGSLKETATSFPELPPQAPQWQGGHIYIYTYRDPRIWMFNIFTASLVVQKSCTTQHVWNISLNPANFMGYLRSQLMTTGFLNHRP